MEIERATFAAGCFWHVQNAFDELPGVLSTLAGYTGGWKESPKYIEVCSGKTGHAEAVQIEFDPKQISYSQLLEVFWKIHDPTLFNQQGADIGEQYRSVIFYHDKKQEKKAINSKKKLQKSLSRIIVTEIRPAENFWPAEKYHQQFLKKGGGHLCQIRVRR